MSDEIYVNLPPNYIAVPYYPGYFWNIKEQHLYSMKVTGVLKPLKLQKPNRWNSFSEPLYAVSKKGVKRYLRHSTLVGLPREKAQVPVMMYSDIFAV